MLNNNLRRGLKGMCISVFMLHLIVLIMSLHAGRLIPILPNALHWPPLESYTYQFLAACWTGFITPLAFGLLGDTRFKEHISIIINFILMFTVYFIWSSFFGGLSLSLLSIVILFFMFIIVDYWCIYLVQYLVLRHTVTSVNKSLSNIDR